MKKIYKSFKIIETKSLVMISYLCERNFNYIRYKFYFILEQILNKSFILV